ncbi:hypothetical protein [Asticcacaulis excentricus]|uniref:Putative N-acetylgalactosaminyl-diphosphoundecaprenol glucuronosyltransferase n=1 Tax=Asticcacaulis excentricus TaxID=78587 RepID=A0A3G9GAB3_9CAUL|nr:hypothetical protein [Asticcacaulis excentricus]BBF81368.1 putative N-acetylgalactosaminyl-diphosphoundecaprenol glucuronosyltransferase [Asticcacaulis excentricus]
MKRVALVIDPYSTRGVASFLSLVGLFYVDLAKALEREKCEVFIIGTYPALNDLRARRSDFNRYLSGSPSTWETFIDTLSDWDNEAIERWRRVTSGAADWTQTYKNWFTDIKLFEYDFDCAIYWGNNASLINALTECGVQTLALELGPMRSPFPEVVVYSLNASPATSGAFARSADDLRNDLSSPASDTYTLQQSLEQSMRKDLFFENVEGMWNQKIADLLASQNCSRRILYVAQLWDDTNAAQWASKESEILTRLVELTRLAGAQLIVKPHPSTSAVYANEVHWEETRAIWNDAAHVIELDIDFPCELNPYLLASVQGVVGGNSSVLFEALLFDKPVHNFGGVYYAPSDGFLSLEEVVTGKFDEAAYTQKVQVAREWCLWNATVPKSAVVSGELARQMLRLNDTISIGGSAKPWFHATNSDAPTSRIPTYKSGVFSGQEVTEQGTIYLRLSDGRSFKIVSDHIVGVLDRSDQDDNGIVIGGWAYQKRNHCPSPFFIVNLSAGRYFVAESLVQRLDIAKAFHSERLRYCGFQFRLSSKDIDYTLIGHNVFAYVGNGQIQRLYNEVIY